MSELGDSFREMRDRRRAARQHYHECPKLRFSAAMRARLRPATSVTVCGWQTPEYEHKRREFGRKALRLKVNLFGEAKGGDGAGLCRLR
jgi:hypothetical protein